MLPVQLPVRPHHPTTFLERGVCVPFTSPVLAGARARPASTRGLELILPNPSGGRGVYILPWESLAEYCRPTIHDIRLQEGVSSLRAVTPGLIRGVAQGVAAEGLAGRAAAAAANEALRTEAQVALLTNFRLLLALLRQEEKPGTHRLPAERAPPAELEARAKAVVAALAPTLGTTPEHVADGLEELARLYATIGIGPGMSDARVITVLRRLEAMQLDIGRWADDQAEEADGGDAASAELVSLAATHTIRCASQTLADAHGLVQNMRGLLADWTEDAAALAQKLARTEWLLDGWEQICLVWQDAAETGRRREAAMELALIVPVIPREASDWLSTPLEVEGGRRLSRTVALNEDWRTGFMTELIARNERLRAQAA